MSMFSEMLTSLRSNTSRCVELQWRRVQLSGLLRMVNEQQDLIVEALHRDLRKPFAEAVVMEVASIKAELVEALNQLEDWTQPQKVKRNLLTILDTAFVQPQPLGVVLIIGAWNYPFQVTLLPLVGALAAGNCVVVKPSEVSAHSSALMQELLPQYLDKECIKIVTGGVKETSELLKEKFDHIFYTGSTSVGRVVYKAAAEHLTPVTLELGGKSPVVVDKSCDVAVVAKRLMWAKLSNAGQTCISPDYVLVDKEIMPALIEQCSKAIETFHSGDSKLTKDFARIINIRHFDRLKQLLQATKGVLERGSIEECDPADLYVPPVLLSDVSMQDAVMQDEIFGPILPFVSFSVIEEALRLINSKPHPLVIYLFSKEQKSIEVFRTGTKSGSLVVNDLLVQMSVSSLPFGGVGESGMGAYHGKATFDCFSHHKAVLIKKQNLEFINDLRYAPSSGNKVKVLEWLLKITPKSKWMEWLPVVAVAALAFFILSLLPKWV